MSTLKVNTISASTSGQGVDVDIKNPKTNRNLIINGAMQIAQRGTSDSSTNGYGTVDRFQVIRSGVDENPTQSQVDVASGTTPYTLGFRKAFRVTNGNQTSVGTSDYISMRYQFEAQDIANSGWNYLSSSSYVTLSFWVKSSVAQNFYGYFETQDGTQYAYPYETGALTADTWTKITKTLPGNSNLTFDNDVNNGLIIYITQFWGTDKTGTITLDQWAAYNTNLRMPDFTSTWYSTNDATFEITGVQFEVGSVPTDFEHRTKQDDYRKCCRYYEKSYEMDTAPGTSTIYSGSHILPAGTSGAGNSTSCSRNFREEKRATPTMAGYGINNTSNAGKWYYTKNGGNGHNPPTFHIIGLNQFSAYVDGGQSNDASSLTGHWTADAEI